jgi:hypothetical protein
MFGKILTSSPPPIRKTPSRVIVVAAFSSHRSFSLAENLSQAFPSVSSLTLNRSHRTSRVAVEKRKYSEQKEKS